MIRKSFLVTYLAAAMLVLAATSESPNLIQNGSLEIGADIPGGTWITRYAPDYGVTIANWDIISGSVDYSEYWQAADGKRSLDLSGDSAGAISQTFPTKIGRDYVVAFAFAGNPNYGGVKHLRVSAAGKSEDYSFNTAGHTYANMGWVDRCFHFTANASTTTLQFQSLDGGNPAGPTLDNVRVFPFAMAPKLLPLLLPLND